MRSGLSGVWTGIKVHCCVSTTEWWDRAQVAYGLGPCDTARFLTSLRRTAWWWWPLTWASKLVRDEAEFSCLGFKPRFFPDSSLVNWGSSRKAILSIYRYLLRPYCVSSCSGSPCRAQNTETGLPALIELLPSNGEVRTKQARGQENDTNYTGAGWGMKTGRWSGVTRWPLFPRIFREVCTKRMTFDRELTDGQKPVRTGERVRQTEGTAQRGRSLACGYRWQECSRQCGQGLSSAGSQECEQWARTGVWIVSLHRSVNRVG